MSTNGSTALIDGIRQAYAEAEAEGQPRPGRPTLVKMLANPPEITEHQVRKAKELVDEELTSPPPADASETPATPPTAKQDSTDADGATSPQAAGDSPAPAAASVTPAAPPARHDVGVLVDWWRRFRQRPWALILMGVGAGFSVWSGWVGLGQMCGFGPVQPLPGIWDELVINSAIVLPISVEAYGAYALRRWLSPGNSRRTSIYAGVSAIASLLVGGAAQVAYHLLKANGYTTAPWRVVMAVALVPVVVLALASILAKLVSVDRQAGASQ